ncbi:MAG: nitroreductase family protein [Candidatus Lokiarchaeota archaeon]|nr:nitroreductase family protein [Candidatus Lokiarchaeota archaeon]
MVEKNSTLKLIENRRTIRAYSKKELTQEEINTIIHGAMRAPTAGNMMMYSILQITDQDIKDKLVKTCDNQPHIAKAPLVLIFLADMQRWWDYFSISKVPELCEEIGEKFDTPQESDLLLASCDALIAAQNAVITAESLGIGSCYIGDIMENYEIHREMFNLPKWVFPIAMVCFGYPRGDKEKIPLTSRFPQKFIHFKNKYQRLSEEELTEMFQNSDRKIVDKKAKNMGQEVYLRKTGADFTKEMRRSVKAAIKVWLSENDE